MMMKKIPFEQDAKEANASETKKQLWILGGKWWRYR